ncbi:MAG: hypothetical protein QNI84_16825 [Henriciella sp.]|nr:hypothetical protein [Henriciella sp.]
MTMKVIGLGALAAVLTCGVASADETWMTEMGEVIYETDLANGMAVLSYPVDDEVRGLAYIAGLAGEYTDRTGYEGVWMEPPSTKGGCDIEIAAPETGEISNTWGRVRVVFVDPDFPGTFVAMRGNCFNEPTEMLVARPIVGGDQ